jgi:nitronate monooxygenase
MWPDDRFRELVGIELPIIQAPMAGSSSTAMAIAVSEAGGLGSLACATLGPAELRSEVEKVLEKSAGPINVNFFAHRPPQKAQARHLVWLRQLSRYFREFGATPPTELVGGPVRPFDAEHCDVIEELRPRIVSFHFGLPSRDLVDRLRSADIRVMSSATSVEEAVWLVEHGCDAVIAQGYEAGGHRGSFLEDDPLSAIGLFSLVPQIAAAVDVPVVAAGGIAEGCGVAAAFALGASAVQVGTAFLFSEEAMVNPLAARTLRSEAARRTAITNVFSGRPARCIVNRAIEEVGAMSTQPPDFPLGFSALGPLRAAAEARGLRDFSPHYCGQSASLCESMSAGDLTRRLAREGVDRLSWIRRGID